MQQAQILDGRAIAADLQQALKTQVQACTQKIKLCVVLVGENPASQIYVQQKHKAFENTGLLSETIYLPSSISQTALFAQIDELNQDQDVHGILVQLPLPDHIDADAILQRIDPIKDVDCFHPTNVGLLAQRMPRLRPCTPYGMIKMMNYHHIAIKGKHAVVVGASNIVGRPMAFELLIAGATVTICHRFTEDLADHVARADILIAAAGKPKLIKGNWIKPGAVVLDVGIHRTEQGLCGDVEFEAAAARASWISPVPGGVGPMTVHCLIENTLKAYELQQCEHAL